MCIGKRSITATMKHVSKNHMNDRPLAHGHTISSHDIAFMAETPDKSEATVFKQGGERRTYL